MTATPIDLDLIEKWRTAGLEVILDEGWENRGRPGAFAPRGNMHHHVGSSGNGIATARWMFRDGRPDLRPPLCQISTDRQGRLYVGAAGRANHAGKAKAFGSQRAGDGNEKYVGWEHQNNGTEGWPKDQYEAMVLATAIANLHNGWSADDNPGHKETSITGKWDPGALDMRRFREDIAAAMRNERAPKMTHVQLSRLALVQAHAALSKSLEELDQAAQSRKVAKSHRAAIAAARTTLGIIIRRFPER